MSDRGRCPYALSLLVLTAVLTAIPASSSSSTWTQITSGSPPTRSGAASAFDPVSGKIVLFGGYQITPSGGTVYLNDTWTFDGSTWTKMKTSSKGTPSVRTSATMAYDAVTQEVVMFG